MTRYLLELRDPDVDVVAEVLYSNAASAGLVGDDGRPLSYGQTIPSLGREWRVQTAERVQTAVRDTTYIRIICEAVSTDAEVERSPSDHVDPGRASRHSAGRGRSSTQEDEP